jgi:hypothetical protein
MAHLTANSAGPSSQSFAPPERERFEGRGALRLAVVTGLFLVFASLFGAFSIRVGTHLVAAWWFQSLHCFVGWEVHETNWREGGTTSVFSDAGLICLEGMKNLKVVNLGATHVTKQGLAKLQMARPDLTIELDVEPAVEEGVKMRRGIAP